MLLPHVLAALGAVMLGFALHPFTTYPLSLAVLARLRPRPHLAAPLPPGCKVAICVCAYNEAPVIAARSDNLLQLRESVPDLDILVYVDAASDGTAAKTPDDFVTVDLASRTLVQYTANDLGMPAAASSIRKLKRKGKKR